MQAVVIQALREALEYLMKYWSDSVAFALSAYKQQYEPVFFRLFVSFSYSVSPAYSSCIAVPPGCKRKYTAKAMQPSPLQDKLMVCTV